MRQVYKALFRGYLKETKEQTLYQPGVWTGHFNVRRVDYKNDDTVVAWGAINFTSWSGPGESGITVLVPMHGSLDDADRLKGLGLRVLFKVEAADTYRLGGGVVYSIWADVLDLQLEE